MKPVSENEKIKLGVIGLGARGKGQLGMLLGMDGVEVVSVCDVIDSRVSSGLQKIRESTGKEAKGYADYRDLINAGGIDAVLIFTSWQTHIRIAIAAMRKGIYAATEVGGATSVEECWSLVRACEETGTPCMMLENANYGGKQLALLRMVKENLFGELIHCTGAYQHDLRDEIGLGREINHYRFDHFVNRNAELYPTHEIGPLAKYLDINRGNRFMSLVSMSSKSKGLSKWYKESRRAWNSWVLDELNANYKGERPEKIENYDMIGRDIACGDVVTTMIKCARGETITIVHDCTLARARLSNMRVQGTQGIYMGDSGQMYIEGTSPVEDQWETSEPYFKEYEHPLWTETSANRDKGSHGGTDHLVMSAFLDAVRRGVEPPIDVYDMAAWMAITALSEDSITLGSTSVVFPDFTGGRWMKREPVSPSKYALDNIYWDCFKYIGIVLNNKSVPMIYL